jgi:UPF0042 nucleotide-binding protein
MRCYIAPVQVIVLTGISGSGKSVALAALEDLGFFCTDNLPSPLLPELVAHAQGQGLSRIAIAIDSRSGSEVNDLKERIQALRQHAAEVRVIFLTASTPDLFARFSETRRRHPLNSPDVARALGLPDNEERALDECITLERELFAPLAELGIVIDTTSLKPQVLRTWLKDMVRSLGNNVLLTFESFAFKHGVPDDADLVFDVRSLPNPHYDPVLKPLTGLDAPVADFLASHDLVQAMVSDIEQFIAKWLPEFMRDGRNYLTVAIGCTGGQHRSVYVAERLAERFRIDAQVVTRHRQLSMGRIQPSALHSAVRPTPSQ